MRPNSVSRPVAVTTPAAVAGRHRGAHEHHVRHVDGGDVLVQDGVGRLAHRVGLAGEGDVVGRHLVLARQPRVGADGVALLQDHDVAGHQVGGRRSRSTSPSRTTLAVAGTSLRSASVAFSARYSCRKPMAALRMTTPMMAKVTLRLSLRSGAVGEQRGDEHQHGRHLEQDREELGELGRELVDERLARLLRQHVGAVRAQALEGLGGAETPGRGAQLGVDLLLLSVGIRPNDLLSGPIRTTGRTPRRRPDLRCPDKPRGPDLAGRRRYGIFARATAS